MSSNIDTFLNDFRKYRDQFGLNQLYTDGVEGFTTQNGALFTAEYLFCLIDHAKKAVNTIVLMEEIERLKHVYGLLEIPAGSGLTRRAPDSGEGDSMDNNGASIVFSTMFDNSNFAKRMYAHGRDTRAVAVDMVQDPIRNMRYYPIAWLVNFGKAPRFFWNNTRPNEFCIWGWYGRSPGFVGLARYCAEGKISPFQSAALWVGQFIGCFKSRENTDARKLPYIVWQLMRRKNWFWSLSYKLWCFILKMQYKGGMRDVYTKYYKDPNHPLRKYSPEYLK